MSEETRAGIGYDAHPFADGRKLVLGGVTFEGERGLEGHSDADVVAHAVVDALVGAAGLGDIGMQFPNASEHYRDADSIELLREAMLLISEPGWKIANVDVTVMAEAPNINEQKSDMEQKLGDAMGILHALVNVKATTNEKMGFVGRGEGIAAMAVALIER